jgi:hypothetical protein
LFLFILSVGEMTIVLGSNINDSTIFSLWNIINSRERNPTRMCYLHSLEITDISIRCPTPSGCSIGKVVCAFFTQGAIIGFDVPTVDRFAEK